MRRLGIRAACALTVVCPSVSAAPPQGPALGADRITQDEISSGTLSRDEIRLAGRLMFITPFNKLDGYGDGPPGQTPAQRRQLGHRTTLQANGAFLRINGLDAQTCLECHSIVSAATRPFAFGVGGVGSVNNVAIGFLGASFVNADDDPLQVTDPDGLDTTGRRNINGRVINPPFVFGAGGVELLAKEMTRDLEALRSAALGHPNTTVDLLTKGVRFGTLSTDAQGEVLTSAEGKALGVVGIDADPHSPTFLVVQPFGRKGEADTTRAFDVAAFQFHLGMQPVEVVGAGSDDDGDGVTDEIRVGELSALSVFLATMDRPQQRMPSDPVERRQARRGATLFEDIGCADCHRPALQTREPLSDPELPSGRAGSGRQCLLSNRSDSASHEVFREFPGGCGGTAVRGPEAPRHGPRPRRVQRRCHVHHRAPLGRGRYGALFARRKGLHADRRHHHARCSRQ